MATDRPAPATDCLWDRIDDALDRRVDPLDDPDLVERLLSSPADLDEFARLAGRLRCAATLPPSRPRRRLVAAGVVLFSIALFAIVLIATWRFAERGPARDEVGADGAPQSASGTRVLDYRIEWESSDGSTALRSSVAGDGRVTSRHTTRSRVSTSSPDRAFGVVSYRIDSDATVGVTGP